MYGVVLLLAVTAGGESADLGRRGGCKGCSGCGTYVASCSGCSGCRGYASSCYGGGYASSCYGGHSHHGHHGCCGHIQHGCCGTVIHSSPAKKMAAASPNAATVVVTLPADAKLTIDGTATTSTSSERTFETPDLVVGKTYSYTLEATFQKEGKSVVVSKKVTIEAGKTSTIDLNQAQTPVTGVARN